MASDTRKHFDIKAHKAQNSLSSCTFQMSIEELADFDDIATALVVDPYLSQQTHKMKKFTPNVSIWSKLRANIVKHRSDSEKTFELIKNYIPKLVDYSNINLNNVLSQNKILNKTATLEFLESEKSQLKHRFRSLTKDLYTSREYALLKSHIIRFLQVLDPSKSGIDIVACTRYSNDKKYDCGAKIVSLRKFKKGEILENLVGVVASEKSKRGHRNKYFKNTAIISGVNDFSVTISTRTKRHQLWLGPAAYMNHDCHPNCRLRATGTTKNSSAIYEITRKVEPGEEILLHYGNNFFGIDNSQCECKTCEIRNVGKFMSPNTRAKIDKRILTNGGEGLINNLFQSGPQSSIAIGGYTLRQNSRSDRKN